MVKTSVDSLKNSTLHRYNSCVERFMQSIHQSSLKWNLQSTDGVDMNLICLLLNTWSCILSTKKVHF